MKARQFSPDPVINVGFLAFMAAMGLDLVYKVTRTLSYFEESELTDILNIMNIFQDSGTDITKLTK